MRARIAERDRQRLAELVLTGSEFEARRARLIGEITCASCRLLAWHDNQHPRRDRAGAHHHPACPVRR